MNIAIIILAAGRSFRFQKKTNKHEHKLLHIHNNRTLLENSLETLKSFNKEDLWFVLGAQKDKIGATLQDYQTVYNPDFKLGMGHSIAAGVQTIKNNNKKYDAVLISLADQIALSTADFHTLKRTFNGLQSAENRQLDVVAAEFYSTKKADTKIFGPPAIFPQYYFSYLQQLKGDQGAKSLLHKLDGQKKLVKVPLNNAQIDIDTREDLANYLTRKQ